MERPLGRLTGSWEDTTKMELKYSERMWIEFKC
jgi:hypothetical protein